MNYRNIYWDEYLMSDASKTASIIAIGDSWFWYPFPGGSLLNALAPILEAGQHTVLAIGKNGAEAFDYVNGVYGKIVDRALDLHGGAGISAVLLSGGGNDFAGYNDLRPLLARNCSGAPDEPACYIGADGADTLALFMSEVGANLHILLSRVFAKVGPNAQVFLHNYDYARPSGVALGGESWLLSALLAAKVPAHLRDGCIRLLIDRYTDELIKLAAAWSPRVHLVDTRGTLAAGDWANELHPTPTGFAKIAQRWKAKFQACGV